MPATELAGKRKVKTRMDNIIIGYVPIFRHKCAVEYVLMEKRFVVHIPYGDSCEDKQYQVSWETVKQWNHEGKLYEFDYETYQILCEIFADKYNDDPDGSDMWKEISEIYSAVQQLKPKRRIYDSVAFETA